MLSEAAAHAAGVDRMQRLRPQDVLDSLAAHIAVLDEAGVIAAVNRPWRDFATANGVAPAIVCEGANYLQVCDEASGQVAETSMRRGPGHPRRARGPLCRVPPGVSLPCPRPGHGSSFG